MYNTTHVSKNLMVSLIPEVQFVGKGGECGYDN